MEGKFKEIADALAAIRAHIAEVEKTIAKLRQDIKGVEKKAEPPAPPKRNGASESDVA